MGYKVLSNGFEILLRRRADVWTENLIWSMLRHDFFESFHSKYGRPSLWLDHIYKLPACDTIWTCTWFSKRIKPWAK